MATAREAAAQYLGTMPATLQGRVWRLAMFASDEDCRFFYPRRANEFHGQMNSAIAREVRKRKGVIERLTFTPEEYWNDVGPDSPDAKARAAAMPEVAQDGQERRAWIEHRIGLMP